MPYAFSRRSKDRLEGVHPSLVSVCELAIARSSVDFGITCGLRSVAQQEENVRLGRSKTMKSRHLPQDDGYSHAVDVVVWHGGEPCWELNLYDDVADAFLSAGVEEGVTLTWGAAWHKPLTEHGGTCESLMLEYIDLRRSQSRRPFLDGPHFQLEM